MGEEEFQYLLPNEQPPLEAQGIPVPHTTTQRVEGQWSTGLCDCFEDVGLCCLTCWFPCVTFGRIAEIVDRGSPSCGTSGALYGVIMGICALMGLPGLQFVYSCLYRSKMRSQHNLAKNPCTDCCVHFCCEACALCQEYRELRSRGYDMTIGWEGNVRKFQDAATATPVGMPPSVPGGMYR